jgi:hypothetical protein
VKKAEKKGEFERIIEHNGDKVISIIIKHFKFMYAEKTLCKLHSILRILCPSNPYPARGKIKRGYITTFARKGVETILLDARN